MTCFNNCGNHREHNRLFCSDRCRYEYFRRESPKKPPSQEYKKLGGNPRLYKSNPRKTLDKETGEVKLVWNQEEITWGKELSFPDFAGTVLNIIHTPQQGDTYDMKKPSKNIIPSKRVKEFMEKVHHSCRLLGTEHGFSLPHVLTVDDEGMIHLLMSNQSGNNTVVDIVLREGYSGIVTKTKVVKNRKECRIINMVD